MNNFIKNNKLEIIFLTALLLTGLFFSTYKLAESPPVWFDEGVFIQSAMSEISFGHQGLQLAPGEITTAGYITAGYPFIYPLSLSFKYLGIGLLSARAVMAAFIITLIFIAYLLIRKQFNCKIAAFSSLLLVSFPPLYGHGKNVLGEVPGTFFLVLFLFFVWRAQQTNKIIYYILAGLAAGLCASTKPVFLIILLPLLLLFSLFILKKNFGLYIRPILLSAIAFLAAIAVWFTSQFQSSFDFIATYRYYTNPNGVDNYYQAIIGNLERFFTEPTPVYFLMLILVWTASIVIRQRARDKHNSLSELFAFSFSVLLSAAYLKTAGFYRYFLPANILALIYFPYSLYILLYFFNGRYLRLSAEKAGALFLAALVILAGVNFYQLIFNSWVADHYSSKKTAVLSDYFNSYEGDKSIFFYNTPELVIFFPFTNYYQYTEFTSATRIGGEQLEKIIAGVPDEIIMPTKKKAEAGGKLENFALYQTKDQIDSYTILERIK